MTIRDVRIRVVDYNERVQQAMLDAEISRRQSLAERGIFEPAVVFSGEHVDNERENTTEQTFNLFGQRVFNQRNEIYNGGLEFLAASGGRFRVGYSLSRFRNNLNNGVSEYVSNMGVTLNQPLLKNFGPAATMARIRLAASASDIAFQDYRRELMLVLAQAEAAYWDLYLTQEQARISSESVRVAERILEDNRARLDVGKSSELEVLQSEAGLSERRTRESDAFQRLSEAVNQLTTLLSGSAIDAGLDVRAVDEPTLREVPDSFYDSYRRAFELNPDYLGRREQVSSEDIRLAFVKNQRLPQLDLNATYGLNGLGDAPASAWDDVERANYPAWTVGVELRLPLTGGVRERNELEAAKLSKRKALVGLKEVEVQIINSLETALLRLRNRRANVLNYQSVADYHRQLLDTELARLEVGKTDSRTVLETEEELFEARINALQSLVDFQKAQLEQELVEGSVLETRGVDLTRDELKQTTYQMLANHQFSGSVSDAMQRDAAGSGSINRIQGDAAGQKRARDQLRDAMGAPRAVGVPAPAPAPTAVPVPMPMNETRIPPSPAVSGDGGSGATDPKELLRRKMEELRQQDRGE